MIRKNVTPSEKIRGVLMANLKLSFSTAQLMTSRITQIVKKI